MTLSKQAFALVAVCSLLLFPLRGWAATPERPGVGGIETQLEGNCVLLKNIRQALEFDGGSSEKHHAITAFDEVARFSDGGLNVAVEGHGRPAGRLVTGLQ